MDYLQQWNIMNFKTLPLQYDEFLTDIYKQVGITRQTWQMMRVCTITSFINIKNFMH